MDLPRHFFEKLFIIICLLASIYYTIICPCKVIVSCHTCIIYTLLLIAFVIVLYHNYFIKNIL